MHHVLRLGPVTLSIPFGFLFGFAFILFGFLFGVACVGGSEERDLSPDAKNDTGNDRSSRLAKARIDGSAQSPINVANAIPTPLRNINFNYQTAQLNIVNNGHTIQGSYGKAFPRHHWLQPWLQPSLRPAATRPGVLEDSFMY